MRKYIEINGWQANIKFSSAHIIPEYNRCGRLHGHTYSIHAKVFGEVDEKGILIDFRFLKKVLKSIADELDHRIIIPEKSGMVKIEDDRVVLSNGEKRYVFPREDCAILPLKSSSAENLAMYIMDRFVKEIKGFENIHEVEIGVDEGFGQGARLRKRLR